MKEEAFFIAGNLYKVKHRCYLHPEDIFAESIRLHSGEVFLCVKTQKKGNNEIVFKILYKNKIYSARYSTKQDFPSTFKVF